MSAVPSGFLTTALRNVILDGLFGGLGIASPRLLYFGLSLLDADPEGSVLEPRGVDYARVAVRNDPGTFPPAVGGLKRLAFPVVFAAPACDWGPIRSVFLADRPAGGAVLASINLEVARQVRAGGKPPRIHAGMFTVSFE